MSTASASKALAKLWKSTNLPPETLQSISLTGSDVLPSSFKLGDLSLSTIGAAALAASQILSLRSYTPLSTITLDARDSCAEFRSEQFARLDGDVIAAWDELAGVYETKDGFVRPHTNWDHHKLGFLKLLGLPKGSSKAEVTVKMKEVVAHDFAEGAMQDGLPVSSLRSFGEWDAHPQGQAAAQYLEDSPVHVELLHERPPKPFRPLSSERPLEGVRVLDLTRVIAGPTAGRTLACYGADVLWITAPHLPSLPGLDFDTSRGKRAIQLDLRLPHDRETFTSLLRTADVLLQGYRPGAISRHGFSPKEVAEINPDIVYASLSAWGSEGPWKDRRGFDSVVQTAVGFNDAEGKAFAEFEGKNESERKPKPFPCQALDHGSGYLLAFGIQAALYKRATVGGSYLVTNSLLATATFLRSLGRSPVEYFARPLETLEELESRGGTVKVAGMGGKEVESVGHSAKFEAAEVGWKFAARALDGDKAEWNS